MSAGCTTACSSRPSVSTRIWRFLPLSSCQHHSRSDRCGAPFFRALHALAVDDAGRRARFTIHGFATLHVERVMNAIQRAVLVPKVEITKQRALGRQIFGNVTPLASRAQHIHETVHDFPRLNRALPSATFGRWNNRLDVRPLIVRQIARIAQLVTNEHGTDDSSEDQDRQSDLHPDPEVTDCRLDSVPPWI